MKAKVKIQVRPVAWAGDNTVTMYQGFASWKVNNDRTMQIIGDPARTESKAFDNLRSEHLLWRALVEGTEQEYKRIKNGTEETDL